MTSTAPSPVGRIVRVGRALMSISELYSATGPLKSASFISPIRDRAGRGGLAFVIPTRPTPYLVHAAMSALDVAHSSANLGTRGEPSPIRASSKAFRVHDPTQRQARPPHAIVRLQALPLPLGLRLLEAPATGPLDARGSALGRGLQGLGGKAQRP